MRDLRLAILQMDSHEDRSPRVRLLIGMALAGEQEVRNEFSLLNRTTTGGVDLPKAVDLAKEQLLHLQSNLHGVHQRMMMQLDYVN